MNRAFHNVVDFAALSPHRVASMASANAARQLGLLETYGTLEPGKAADIAILDPATGEVQWTIIEGKIAYQR
jgi:N-acetylglucosamine-6-phosphate deacetylase